MALEIVQYSFCKSPLELVVVAPISICLFVNLYFVALHYRPFIVSSFAETSLIFCGMPCLCPICGVLYIFYYVNLVLDMLC